MQQPPSNIPDGRRRIVIEGVAPEIDSGEFPIRRTRGETVVVEADIFVDGHEVIAACLLFRRDEEPSWREAPMAPLVNDRWRGSFVCAEIGPYLYSLAAWIDRFRSWRGDLRKKADAGAHAEVDLLSGALLIDAGARRAAGADARALAQAAKNLRAIRRSLADRVAEALSEDLLALMDRYPDRSLELKYSKDLAVVVEREKARFSAWYEMFPRSAAARPGRHGTFKDCERLLPYVASMGFDTLYLPPIHPIGRTHRKGKNNQVTTTAKDPGSPWAIGAKEGGHKSIHPELGTLAYFKSLVRKAEKLDIEIALDLALALLERVGDRRNRELRHHQVQHHESDHQPDDLGREVVEVQLRHAAAFGHCRPADAGDEGRRQHAVDRFAHDAQSQAFGA